MPLELEEVLAAGREAPAPGLDQLPANAELARHLALGPALVLDRDHGAEHVPHRMNLSREGVAGQHALAPTAGLAASQDDRDPAPATVQGGEASLHPARGELDLPPPAATAVTPAQDLVT
jgi:hypothetical protein